MLQIQHPLNSQPAPLAGGRPTPNAQRQAAGFTLLEILIYIGLVAIGLFAASSMMLNIISGKAKLSSIEEVSQNARFTVEQIADRIRNADAVNSPAAGASNSALSLQMSDPNKNPTIFDLLDGKVRIKEGSAAAVDLSSAATTVTSLQFFNISYPGTPATIRIATTVEKNNPGDMPEYDFSGNFYTTANVRKKP